jgi:CubicO group peptidase (beta-lactamase class C family)
MTDSPLRQLARKLGSIGWLAHHDPAFGSSVERQIGYLTVFGNDATQMRERLRTAQVALLGAGAAGSILAQHLVGAGVRELWLIDHAKTQVVAKALLRQASDVRVHRVEREVAEPADLDAVPDSVDLLMVSTDTPPQIGQIIWQWAQPRDIAICFAKVGRDTGHWGPLLVPSRGHCWPCFESVRKAKLSVDERAAPLPYSFGPANSTVAALCAREAVQYLATGECALINGRWQIRMADNSTSFLAGPPACRCVIPAVPLPTLGADDDDVGAFTKAGLSRVHEVLTGHLERGPVRGVVTLIARHGETHVDAIGAVRPDTIFRIASMTKPITAVAAMILVEECVLRLDDPVDDLLPELAGRRVLTRPDGPLDQTEPAHRAITVRDLLTFLLGWGQLPDAFSHAPIAAALARTGTYTGLRPASVPPPDQYMRLLGALPLVHQPGERWMYNTGSDVLGVLIARASGRSFPDFLRERLFEPLGMTDTGFSVPRPARDRLPAQYMTDPGTGENVLYDPPDGQWAAEPAFPSGRGGLVSTAADYAAFAEMLRGDGMYRGTRIVSRRSVELMTTDQLTPTQKAGYELFPGAFDGTGWGFGVAVTTRRTGIAKSAGTYGWDGGLGTSWLNDPAEDLIAIVLTQQMMTSARPPVLWQDFWTTTYQALDG